jgi:serine protease inhibitor
MTTRDPRADDVSMPGRRAVLAVGAALGGAALLGGRSRAAGPDPAAAALAVRRTSAACLAALAGDWTSSFAFSPLSIGSVAQMLAIGARGRTRADLQAALGLPAEDEAIAADLAALLHQIGSRGGADHELLHAFGLWTRGPGPSPAYAALVRDRLGAEVGDLPADAVEAAGLVNGWASRATAGRVDAIVPPLDRGVELVAASACLFRARWLAPFDPALTTAAGFRTARGGVADVPMMSGAPRTVQVAEADDVVAVRLPYADGRFEALAVMPAADGPDAKPGPGTLDAALASPYRDRTLRVELPKLGFDVATELAGRLAGGPLGPLVAADADFTGLRRPAPRIDAVHHRLRLDVDEAGTVAAAVTAATGTRSHVVLDTVRFDRPFLFVIQDRRAQVPIAVAYVADPRA